MSEKEKDSNWMQNLWRPAMGWMYMIICLADMLVFPVLWSLLQAMTHQPITQWNPLTLQGAGLFHIAMGAVLGITAWSRGQEKLAGAAGGAPTGSSFGVGVGAPAGAPSYSAGQNQQPLSTPSFTPAPSFGATPTFGGRPAPVQPPHPEL